MTECENWSTETQVCEVLGIPECASCGMYVAKVSDDVSDLEVTDAGAC